MPFFDSQNYSTDATPATDATPENVVLESKFFDASVSNNVLLTFDHYFAGGKNGRGTVEVHNGSSWTTIATYTDSTANPESKLINISSLVGGITNAKVRFRWEGNASNFWAMDNIRIIAPLTYDAGLTKLDEPAMPFSPGTHAIKVTLANYGITTLTSTTINWAVNGVTQTPFTWTGNLPIGASQENINIGNYNFLQGKQYNLKIWQSKPNGQNDPNTLNDELNITLYTSLNGIYTIGGVAPDFVNFTEAVTVLNNAGVAGAVIFKVRNGTYNEQIAIGKVLGASPTNTITFEAESGDSTKAILNYSIDNSVLDYTLALNGAEYITFKKLGIARGANSTTIKLTETTKHILFTNCFIQLSAANWSSTGISLASTVSNITLHANAIQARYPYDVNAATAIAGNGTSISVTDNKITATSSHTSNLSLTGTNLTITNNIFTKGSITVSGADLLVTANKAIAISITSSTGSFGKVLNNILSTGGITTSGTKVTEVTGNKITAVTNGIGINLNSSGTLVANNFVQTQGLGATSGIRVSNTAANSKIVFNSVLTTGTDPVTARALEVAGTPTGLVIKNNIFANSGGGYAAYMPSALTSKDIDYNNYFSSQGKLGYYNGTAYTNLTAWGTALGGDANSKNVNPFFKSTTDLRPYQRALNGGGLPIGGILLDLDGEIRNSSAPDMGADEFDVDFGITRLISPTLDCNLVANDKVTVNVSQFGDIPFIDLKLAYQVNGGTIYIDTIPGQIVTDIPYTFKQTQNLLTEGTYNFKVWLVGANDDNVNNDTLRVARFKKPSPVVDFSFVTACAGVGIPFTATASVTPGSIARFEWDFGDGDTTSLQAPIHLYDTSGTYTVTLRAYSNEGCYSSISKAITVTTTPKADFNILDACVGQNVVFTNQSKVSSGSMSFFWNFGDGTTSTLANPSKKYTAAGTYQVKLVVSNAQNCSDSLNKSITIHALPEVSFASLDPVCVDASSFSLTGGLPKGGVYTGTGVNVSTGKFSPSVSGVGNHIITYTFTNDYGCVSTATHP